jgi:alanine dehydrogenase
VLHLTAGDVERLLPMPAAVEAARATARAVADGLAHAAERTWHRHDGMPGRIGVMPCLLADDGNDPAIFTTKVVGVFPGAVPSVAGVIVVQDAASGAPLATVDAAAVTALRTAAHSGLSMQLLALPDVRTIAVLGAGAQGWAHLLAALAVRPVEVVRVWSRTPDRSAAFAERARALPGVVEVVACASPAEAARGAGIVCTCTDSPTPILSRDDVAPGAHVVAIGAYTPDTRELAADLLVRADVLVVDDLEAASHEAGDLLMAVAEGAIDPRKLDGDLPALVSGGVPGRRPGDVTVYKSVGTPAMDAVAVRHLLAAEAAGRFAVVDPAATGKRPGTTGTLRAWHVDGPDGRPALVPDADAEPVPVHVVDRAEADPGRRRRRCVVRTDDGAAVVANVVVLAEPPEPPAAAG